MAEEVPPGLRPLEESVLLEPSGSMGCLSVWNDWPLPPEEDDKPLPDGEDSEGCEARALGR